MPSEPNRTDGSPGGEVDGPEVLTAVDGGVLTVTLNRPAALNAITPRMLAELGDVLEAAAEDTIVTRLYSGKTMRNIKNPLIQSWEASGIRALPMGLQGLLTRDLLYSIRQAGLDELLMNAAGQTAGLLKEIRPAKEILLDLVGEAADALSRRLPSTVQAAVA